MRIRQFVYGGTILRITVAAIGCCLLTATHALAQVPAVDLGTLGGNYSAPYGVKSVNQQGAVVGVSTTATGDEHAFLWTQAAGMIDLGTLGGRHSIAIAINDNGVVIGNSFTMAGELHAFLWSPGGGLQDINPPGAVGSEARAINNNGQVAMVADIPALNYYRGFRWSAQEGHVDLGTLGCPGTIPSDINAAGEVTGQACVLYENPTHTSTHAFFWSATTGMLDLGSGGGSGNSYGVRINDHSEVVGFFPLVDSGQHAHGFYWSQATGMMDAGGLPGTPDSAFSDINNLGQAVGAASLGDTGSLAIAWSRAAGMTDVGFGNAVATGINDDGHIIGIEIYGQPAYLWTAASGAVELRGGVATYAWAINNHGLIAGQAWDGVTFDSLNGAAYHAVVWRYSTSTAPIATPTGSGVHVATATVSPGGLVESAEITFDHVMTAGQTTTTFSAVGPPPPVGFSVGQPPLYFDVETTSTFSGSAVVCFGWTEDQLTDEASAQLFHYENGGWQNVTISVDVLNNTICGRVASFSPFLIAQLGYVFGGFDRPLLSDGSASIQQPKAGRTIPVKFQLRLGGQLTGAATATVAVYRVLNVATGTVDTTNLTQDAGASADSGNQFRYDATSQQYVFNLSTKDWLAPATYRIYVTLSDGSVYSVDFSLR